MKFTRANDLQGSIPSDRSQAQAEQSQADQASDPFSQAASQVREDIERMVEGFDFQGVSKKVEQLGRSNPVGLAMTALALGVAVGLLMRKRPQEEGSKKRPDLAPVSSL